MYGRDFGKILEKFPAAYHFPILPTLFQGKMA
jgi:hypothetical protein